MKNQPPNRKRCHAGTSSGAMAVRKPALPVNSIPNFRPNPHTDGNAGHPHRLAIMPGGAVQRIRLSDYSYGDAGGAPAGGDNTTMLNWHQIKKRATTPILLAVAAALAATAGAGCFAANWFGGGPPTLAYVSTAANRIGMEQVHLVDPDDGAATRISGRTADARHPRWSPERQFLAWVVVEELASHLTLYDTDGGETAVLARDVDPDQPPIWSPDGSMIAYVSAADGEPDIYVVDLENREATRLTFNPERERIGDWSPDGNWLVFTEAGRDGLLLRNPDGVNRIRLTDDPDADPVWSPQGDRIAFVRQNDADNRDLYVLESKEWTDDIEETVVSGGDADEFAPAWSSDGRRIVFVARADAQSQSEIYTIQADGKDRQQLTHNQVDDLAPVWSAKGDWIAFVSYAHGNAELLYMDGNGEGQQRITRTDAADTQPDW